MKIGKCSEEHSKGCRKLFDGTIDRLRKRWFSRTDACNKNGNDYKRVLTDYINEHEPRLERFQSQLVNLLESCSKNSDSEECSRGYDKLSLDVKNWRTKLDQQWRSLPNLSDVLDQNRKCVQASFKDFEGHLRNFIPTLLNCAKCRPIETQTLH